MRHFKYNFNLLDMSFIDIETQAEKPVDEPLYADINGDSGDNTLVGTSGNDTINGLGGNDTLDGLGGTNTLIGGTGTDTFIVSARGSHTTTITDFEDGVEVIDLTLFLIRMRPRVISRAPRRGIHFLAVWVMILLMVAGAMRVSMAATEMRR